MNTTNVRSWYEPQQKWKMQSVRWSFLLQPRKTTLRTALRIVHTIASDLRPSDSSNWISYKKGIKDYIYHGSKKESLLASCVYVVTLHSASILWCKSKYLVNRLWFKIAKKNKLLYLYVLTLFRNTRFKKWPT